MLKYLYSVCPAGLLELADGSQEQAGGHMQIVDKWEEFLQNKRCG